MVCPWTVSDEVLRNIYLKASVLAYHSSAVLFVVLGFLTGFLLFPPYFWGIASRMGAALLPQARFPGFWCKLDGVACHSPRSEFCGWWYRIAFHFPRSKLDLGDYFRERALFFHTLLFDFFRAG